MFVANSEDMVEVQYGIIHSKNINGYVSYNDARYFSNGGGQLRASPHDPW